MQRARLLYDPEEDDNDTVEPADDETADFDSDQDDMDSDEDSTLVPARQLIMTPSTKSVKDDKASVKKGLHSLAE